MDPDKWKDPRWQKVRLEIFNRDGFRCRLCGTTRATLSVHHVRYTRTEPWEEPATNLISVCENCHEIIKHCRNSAQRQCFDRILACCDLAHSPNKHRGTIAIALGISPPGKDDEDIFA